MRMHICLGIIIAGLLAEGCSSLQHMNELHAAIGKETERREAAVSGLQRQLEERDRDIARLRLSARSLAEAREQQSTLTRLLAERDHGPSGLRRSETEDKRLTAQLTAQLDAATSEREAAEQERADAARRLEDLTARLDSRDLEIARLSRFTPTGGETDSDLADARRQITSLTDTLGQRDEELGRLRLLDTERDRLAAQVAAAATEREETTRRLTDANRRIADLNGQVGILLPEVARLHGRSANESGSGNDLSRAYQEIAFLSSSVGQRDEELGRLRLLDTERDRLAAQVAAAATEREETTRRLTDANRRIADLNGQVGILLPEVARLHQLTGKEEGTDRGLADAHRQIASLTGTVGRRDQEIDRLRGALQEADQKKMVKAEKDLVKSLQPEIRSGNVTVHHSGDKLIINLAPALLFEKGKDHLNPAGADTLTRVAGVLKEFPEKPVQVSGHTDNLPIRGALAKLFPTNKELSLARAQQAAKILTDSGVSSSNISQNGYADTQPVADNMTEAGRQKNRRVEILVTF